MSKALNPAGLKKLIEATNKPYSAPITIKSSADFLTMRVGSQIRYVPDADIYCPDCGRVIIKRYSTHPARYIGRQDVNGVMCDVLYIFSGPMCGCGYEIYSVYFPCEGLTHQATLAPLPAQQTSGFDWSIVFLAVLVVATLAALIGR